jgi:MEMO1 family protein
VVTRFGTDAADRSHTAAAIPKLRALDVKWTDVRGEPRLRLQDPLRLSSQQALIPPALTPLLSLLDGTRTLDQLCADYARLTGASLPLGVAEQIVETLERALFLEGKRFHVAFERARAQFRCAPFRAPALASLSYPDDPLALEASFSSFRLGAQTATPLGPIRRASGVLSPHIDYARGGSVYAATWGATLEGVASCDIVVMFGTDHWGGAGQLTLTPQRYATPWGAFQSDAHVLGAVALALSDSAYSEELHHVHEHSIELALVWLHWALRQAGRVKNLPPIIPILCGSFYCYVHAETRELAATGDLDVADLGDLGALPESEPRLQRALDALTRELAGARVLVVSAADLAHMGPAFGDPGPLTDHDKRELAISDRCLLTAVEAGDATDFLNIQRAVADRTRVCGLPPTYWALRLLERLNASRPRGHIVDYAQCPADASFGSVVSIAGALWDERD